ncbi:hypothetical protein [Vibrio sp. B172a]|uniref:hypothetical protein n=1 Tax=Vibrio sp. B172a TaxID=2835790 RepID=UPI00255573A9|nr:hypothetical protein [Vibrio sp. B172a]
MATYTVFDEVNIDPYAGDYRFNIEKTVVPGAARGVIPPHTHHHRKQNDRVTTSQLSVFTIDAHLVHLFENLAALNPPVGQMVASLNVVLAENGEKIVTREDFEQFSEQVEEW